MIIIVSKNILLLLLVGAFIVIFISYPLYLVSQKIEKVSYELCVMNYNFSELVAFEKIPYQSGVGPLSIQQSLGSLQGGFVSMSKSLDETNKEFKSLNKKISNSRLLKF